MSKYKRPTLTQGNIVPVEDGKITKKGRGNVRD